MADQRAIISASPQKVLFGNARDLTELIGSVFPGPYWMSLFGQDWVSKCGIVCIVIPRTDGGAILWEIADVTWGAAIIDEDGKQTASINTEWPNDSEDIDATSKALLKASLRNGAA